MKQPTAELDLRKEKLVALAAQQREQLTFFYAEAQRPITRARQTLDHFGWIKTPWGLALVGLIVWKTPLKRLLKAPVWIWRGYKVTKSVRTPLVRKRRRTLF